MMHQVRDVFALAGTLVALAVLFVMCGVAASAQPADSAVPLVWILYGDACATVAEAAGNARSAIGTAADACGSVAWNDEDADDDLDEER